MCKARFTIIATLFLASISVSLSPFLAFYIGRDLQPIILSSKLASYRKLGFSVNVCERETVSV